MDLSEMFKELYDKNDAADRSVIIADLQDYVKNVEDERQQYLEQTTSLTEEAEKLRSRNGQLHARIIDSYGVVDEPNKPVKHSELSLAEAAETYFD